MSCYLYSLPNDPHKVSGRDYANCRDISLPPLPADVLGKNLLFAIIDGGRCDYLLTDDFKALGKKRKTDR